MWLQLKLHAHSTINDLLSLLWAYDINGNVKDHITHIGSVHFLLIFMLSGSTFTLVFYWPLIFF